MVTEFFAQIGQGGWCAPSASFAVLVLGLFCLFFASKEHVTGDGRSPRFHEGIIPRLDIVFHLPIIGHTYPFGFRLFTGFLFFDLVGELQIIETVVDDLGAPSVRKLQLVYWLRIRKVDLIFVYYCRLCHLLFRWFDGLEGVEKVVTIEVDVQLFGVQIDFGGLVHSLEQVPELIVLVLIWHLKRTLGTAS